MKEVDRTELKNRNLIYIYIYIYKSMTLPPKKCPVYDTKQSDGEVRVMLELWGMRSTPSLLSLPGPL